jgi:hypothetical protein
MEMNDMFLLRAIGRLLWYGPFRPIRKSEWFQRFVCSVPFLRRRFGYAAPFRYVEN